MWKPAIKPFFITLILVLLIGAPIFHKLKKRDTPAKRPSATTSITETTTPTLDHVDEFQAELVEHGWTSDAAQAVISLNADWFHRVDAENELASRQQKTLLAGLGNHDYLMPFLADHPETAGLFAAIEHPKILFDLFDNAIPPYEFLVNLFALHGSRMDAEALLHALQDNVDLIYHLYQRGLVGSEALFIFDRELEGAPEYEQWLREVLLAKLSASDLEMASFINMILLHGPEIRRRLAENPLFRQHFSPTIWPKIVRIAAKNKDLFDIYLDEPRMWDLLLLEEGERLIAYRGPLLPIDLLYGYPELGHYPYPEDLHDAVIQALLQGNELTIQALLAFRDEPLFHALLRRPFPADVLAAAFNNLIEAGDKHHELLLHYNSISDIALRAEVGPGPGILEIWTPFYYTLWEVPKKLIQGRNPTGTEWFNSIADPVSFLYPILKVGVAIVNVGKSITGISGDEPLDENLKSTSIEVAKEQLGETLANQLSDSELVKFGVTGMLSKMQTLYKNNIDRSVLVNTTLPVTFMFQYSGIGSKTLDALNHIEGNYFMRGDTMLVVSPGNDKLGEQISSYFQQTAHVFVTTSSKPQQVLKTQTESSGEISLEQTDQILSWRRNISAWLLMHATGFPSR